MRTPVFLSLRKPNRLAFKLIQEKVFTLVVSTAPRIDGDRVAKLVDPSQDASPLYEEVAAPLREVLVANNSGALPVRFLHLIRPLPDGGWEYFVDAETGPKERSRLGGRVEFNDADEKPVLGGNRTVPRRNAAAGGLNPELPSHGPGRVAHPTRFSLPA